MHMAVRPAPAVLAAFISVRPLVASTLDLLASCLKLTWRLGASAIVWMLLMKLVNSTRVPVLSGVACAIASAVSFGLARLAALITALAGRIDDWRNRLLAKLASKAFATMQERSDASSDGSAQPSPSAPFGAVDPPIDTTSYSDGSVDVSIRRPGAAVSTSTSTQSPADAPTAAVNTRAEYQKMRVKELKAELDRLGVPHADAVEKSDLVDRLVQRIESGGAHAAGSSSMPSPAASEPPRQQQSPQQSPRPSAPSDGTSGGGGFPGGGFSGGGFPGGTIPNFGGEGMPTEQEAMKQLEALMANPEGVKLLQELEQNPAVMAAAMDIAQGGEAAAYKYEDNAEVMAYLRRLETIMGPM